MPATIQGYRPDPRIRQREFAELRRIYDEVIHAQQGAIVFLAGEEGSGPGATLQLIPTIAPNKKPTSGILPAGKGNGRPVELPRPGVGA